MIDKNNFQCAFSDEQYLAFKGKLKTFIKDRFSTQLHSSCCRIQPIISLTAEEALIISQAVKKRCYEFSAGRRCARECLIGSGITDFSVLKGKYGEPLWPQAFTGSITHNSGLAIAVTLPKTLGYIGIDFVDLSDQIAGAHLILNPAELDVSIDEKVENPELLLFSLKESVIKILSPLLQEYIEFKDITILLGEGRADVHYREQTTGINLSWFIQDGCAFTAAEKPL